MQDIFVTILFLTHILKLINFYMLFFKEHAAQPFFTSPVWQTDIKDLTSNLEIAPMLLSKTNIFAKACPVPLNKVQTALNMEKQITAH